MRTSVDRRQALSAFKALIGNRLMAEMLVRRPSSRV